MSKCQIKLGAFIPATLFAALAAVTKNLGFIAAASTTYEDPYILARKFASLDHISKGRAASNVVTTAMNAPFPKIEDADINFSSRQQMMIDIARRHNFTIRQLYQYIASARGHWTLIGTPEQVAGQLQEWFENDGADGFNILLPRTPAGLNDFVELIVPELQHQQAQAS